MKTKTDTICYFPEQMFITRKSLSLSVDMDSIDIRTAENPTAFHQAEETFDNFRFPITFIE